MRVELELGYQISGCGRWLMQLLQRAFRCGLVTFGVLTYSMLACCRPIAIRDIAKLTDSSAVIVVGEVLKIAWVGSGEMSMPEGKPYKCDSMTASIRVDEVLKGQLASGAIQVNYLENPATWDVGPLTNGLTEGTYRMFFLNPHGENFAFASPDQSSMPMSRSHTALSNSSTEDLYTRVLRHLGEALFDVQATSQDRIWTIFLFGHEPSPAVTKMLKEALDGRAARSDIQFRFELLAWLLGRKELFVLPELETAVLSNHDSALINARSKMIYTLQTIDSALSGPILIQALKLPEPPLRAAAAAALAPTSSEDANASATALDEAVVALLQALDDPDDQVKRMAINSLTSIFHAPQCLPSGYVGDQLAGCVAQWKRGGSGYNPSPKR